MFKLVLTIVVVILGALGEDGALNSLLRDLQTLDSISPDETFIVLNDFMFLLCTASIIGPRFVLTVAGCVDEYKDRPGKVTVLVETHSLSKTNVRHAVESIKVHENYNAVTRESDIALLKLKTPVSFSTKAGLNPLGISNVPSGAKAVSSYRGKAVSDGEPFSSDFRYVNSKTMNISECRSSTGNFAHVYDSQICISRRKTDFLSAGLGSPLVSAGRLEGVLSWEKYHDEELIEVFTRVSHYSEWILENSQ